MSSTEQQQLKELKWKAKLLEEEIAQLKKENEFRREMLGFIPKQLSPPVPFKPKTSFILPYRNIWGNNY